jgi:hypothetical protein
MTATSTDGSRSTICAAVGPVMSPGTVSRPSMYTPSVLVWPTVRPSIFRMCASIREVVVLPLVPVIAAMGMREGLTPREQHVDDRPRDVARLAFRGRHVHAKARGRIALADATTHVAVGAGDIRGNEIDAPNIQAEGEDGALGHHAIVRVNDVRDIHRRAARTQVRRRLQVHDLTVPGNTLLVHVALREHALRPPRPG